MFRTGICDARDDRLARWNRSSVHRPFISLTLLDALDRADSRAATIFEAIVYDLRLSSGIYRTTWPGRFSDLNAIVNPILRREFGGRPIEVHDWAASDCLASQEWAESLWREYGDARLVASDLMLNFIRLSRGRQNFFLEPDGAPLQYVRPPFVLPLTSDPPPHYPVNVALANWARRRCGELAEALRRASRDGGQLPRTVDGWEVSKTSVLHPRALQAASRRPERFQMRMHSVFDALAEPADVIRTMNIFNPGYFDTTMLQRAASVVAASLRERGLWIVGRTTDEEKCRQLVTVLQKRGARFDVVSRINGGAEIESIALAIDVAAGLSPAVSCHQERL